MPAAAIPAAISVAGSIAGGIGGRKAAKKQNQYARDAAARLSPSNVMMAARQFNPQLYAALAGQRGSGGYQNSLYDIAQNPGYIDPKLMNAPYLQSAQRQQSDLQGVQAMLGRNAIGGSTGLGQAYALANLGGRTARDTQLGQQYALWREQQRRSDVDWLSNQQQQAIQAGFQSGGGQAQYLSQQQAPPSYGSMLSNAASAGLTAYGAFQGMQGGGPISTGVGGSGPQLDPNAWKQSPRHANLQYQNLP